MSRRTSATRQRPRSGKAATFAEFIETARTRQGLTRAGLAAAAAVDRATVFRWEAGSTTRPPADQIRRACAVLDVNYVDALKSLGELTDDEIAQAA